MTGLQIAEKMEAGRRMLATSDWWKQSAKGRQPFR